MNVVKTVISVLILMAGTVFLLVPSDERDRVPEGRTVIRYWEKWTGHEGDQMKVIVDEFNRTVGAEKHIYVAYISMSEVDQKTLVATAAGLPPDVAGLLDNQVAQFGAANALEPLDARANARGLTRDYYKPAYYEGCSYEHRLYALPSTPAAVVLYYNKLMFKAKGAELRAAGLDPERPPQTLEEFDRYAAALDTWQGEGEGRTLTKAGYIPQDPGWWLPLMPYWFGADLYDPSTRKLKLDDPRVLAAFQWIGSYSKRLGVDTMRQFRAGFPSGSDSPQSPFIVQQVAMIQQGPWLSNLISVFNPSMNNIGGLTEDQIAHLSRDEFRANTAWAACPFPSAIGGPPVTYTGMDVLVIPQTSKHKDEAFEFLAFVNRQDIMEKLTSMHCKNSPLKQVSASYLTHHPNPYIEVFEELAASPNAHGLPSLPVWPEISAELMNVAEQVYLGLATPEDALRNLQTVGQEKIDRFFELQDRLRRESR